MSNTELAKKGYELFLRGDFQTFIADLVDDHCEWSTPGPKDKLPWAGTCKGKEEIGSFFLTVDKHLEFTEFTPNDFIERDDTVVVIGIYTCKVRSTSKKVSGDWVHVAKYTANGKVRFFKEYADMVALVEAMS